VQKVEIKEEEEVKRIPLDNCKNIAIEQFKVS
jgi:hypothetical protein